MQTYYNCKRLSAERGYFRVTKQTYKELLRNADYKCIVRNQTNNVCVCPRGFGDFECSTLLYKKCFINVTEPAFFKGCASSQRDTPFYLYSITGYDPCEYLDFTKAHEIHFQVHCRTIDESGIATISTEHTGYNYRDVVQEAQFNQFTYVATNPETQFAVRESDEYLV